MLNNEERKELLSGWGENKAAAFLESSGYAILCRNYRSLWRSGSYCPKDEIVYFIEVKTRRGLSFGRGFESVTQRKFQKIQKTAECYIHTESLNREVRVAVVSIDLQGGKEEILLLPVGSWGDS